MAKFLTVIGKVVSKLTKMAKTETNVTIIAGHEAKMTS